MRPLHFLTGSLVIIGISSCISINTIPPEQKLSHEELEHLRRISNDKPVPPVSDQQAHQETQVKPDISCPVFVLPQPDPEPELPLKELSKISPKDQRAIDAIEIQQIADLRDYIRKYKSLLHDEHSKYLTKCFVSDKKNQ